MLSMPVYKPKYIKYHASDRFYIKHIILPIKMNAK